jgi:hypothetical protein
MKLMLLVLPGHTGERGQYPPRGDHWQDPGRKEAR